MALTLREYLDAPLDSYCTEILSEWRNMSRIDIPFHPIFDRPETIGETSGGVNTLGDQAARNLEVSKCLQDTKLPSDPSSWTEEQVRTWLDWCIKEFSLLSVDLSKFAGLNGQLLCSFQPFQFIETAFIKEHSSRLYEFLERIKANSTRTAYSTDPLFPQDFEYSLPMMNSELTSPPHGLTPAITIQNTNPLSFPTTSNAMSANGALLIPPPPYGQNRPHSPALSDRSSPYSSPAGSPMPSPGASPFYSPNASPCPSPSPPMRPHNPSGSGPIQLWQFLLELLTDRDCQNCIAWTGREWEFKLIDPEEVARRWGSRKNKPKMNYEKLSRGLRYYYDKNIIHKVPGKRYVYRFVCDLESMLGMSFTELQHQLKGDHTETVARPIRIERQHYPSQNLLPSPANYGPDMQSLSLNPASPIPSPLNSPFSVSPGLSGSPITHYGPYMPDFQ